MSRTCIEPAISLDKIANTDLRMLHRSKDLPTAPAVKSRHISVTVSES